MAPSSSLKDKSSKKSGSDIRSFFGSGPSGSSQTTKSQKASIEISDDEAPSSAAPSGLSSSATKRKKVTAVISSEEEEELEKISPPRKKVAPTPRSSLTGINGTKHSGKEIDKKQVTSAKSQTSTSAITSKTNGTFSKNRPPRKTSAYFDDQLPSESDDEAPTVSKTTKKPPPAKLKSTKRRVIDDDDYEELDDDEIEKTTSKKKPTAKTNGKTNMPPPPSPKKQAPAASSSSVSASKVEAGSSKFDWAAAKAAKLAGPKAPGSKAIPDGEPNCLAGLSFVFTGELTSMSREEAVDLAKRFGGRVTGQPSSVTSFVVLGEHAGPAKIRAIQKHGLKTVSEDDFLDLIATRKGVVDEKTRAKMEKEEKKIREAAKEMEKAEREMIKGKGKAHESERKQELSSQLWTVRYAPLSLKEICGNKGQVEKLQLWLHDWSNSLKANFKKPGKNGMNIFRAILITGPPGIGKTTSAHLCAKLEGFTPIELNASDARSKKLVESGTNITNTSLDGWMGGADKETTVAGVKITDRSCLIMDEVDGMSAGDRGGIGALNALIKKTKIPIICIANDRNLPKMKPLLGNTFNISFRKPDAAQIRSRILTIAFKEKMKIPANVIDQLVAGAQSDIRQVVNMLSTWKLSKDSMDFDEGKEMARANEKYSVMTPFNIINKLFGPYLFSPTSRESLGEKMEYYFHDHSFVPLFVQENYLKTEPAKIRDVDGPMKTLQHLRLMDKAASSLSDSDLVDSLIHGPEQHWSLMPLHSVTSTVRPASFLFGMGAGYAGPNAMSFPQWLGQNSKQNKLQRQLNDVQIRMRLKVSGDKPEIRQHYLPALFPRIINPLIEQGSSAVDEVIEYMDEYYLSKDEWDTLVELGLDQNKEDVVLKKISTAIKSTFTRKYNATEHPVPFHKGQELGKPAKKLAGGPAPDIEDVFDLDDDIEEEPETKDDDDDESLDLSKDKFIKQATDKGKKKAAASKPEKGKKK